MPPIYNRRRIFSKAANITEINVEVNSEGLPPFDSRKVISIDDTKLEEELGEYVHLPEVRELVKNLKNRKSSWRDDFLGPIVINLKTKLTNIKFENYLDEKDKKELYQLGYNIHMPYNKFFGISGNVLSTVKDRIFQDLEEVNGFKWEEERPVLKKIEVYPGIIFGGKYHGQTDVYETHVVYNYEDNNGPMDITVWPLLGKAGYLGKEYNLCDK